MDDAKEPEEHRSAETGLPVHDLAVGARKVFDNASDLYHEALTLHGIGALSRALFLHQISLEECAKVDMLGAWAVSLLMGHRVDQETIARTFASHKTKNFTNAYLRPADDAERTAQDGKRWADALDAFKTQQQLFHQESNTAKNASLYVDVSDDGFLAPKERITEAMVLEIRANNERFLAGAGMYVEMLAR